jgi:putative cell wall-binding protein
MAVPLTAYAYVMPLSVEQMADIADTVVEVQVSGSGARWTHDPMTRERRAIVTDVRVNVVRVLKGESRSDIILTQFGGAVGADNLRVSDLPAFAPGERCILFIDENGVVGGAQGKLVIEGGRVPSLGMSVAAAESFIVESATGSAVAVTSPDALVSPMSLAITGLVPATVNAGIGDTITITGSGFGAVQGTGSIGFLRGDSGTGFPRVNGSVVAWSDSQIVCQIPRLAESGQVLVTSNDGAQQLTPTSLKVGYSDSGRRWFPGTVTYRINPNTADLTTEVTAIQRALATWTGCGANVSYVYGGACSSTAYTPNTDDGYNDIYFVASGMPTGVVAQNYMHWNGSVGESDIVFSDTYPWADGPAGSVSGIDVESVALHELGHTVGLDDQYGDLDEVMGSASWGTTRRDLSSYDLAGAHHIWGSVSDTTPPSAPTVSSATHPSQSIWYTNPNPSFTFAASDLGGIAGYSYVLDTFATTVPDTTSEGSSTSKSYSGIADGEWYFHVRAVDMAGNWGAAAHYRVRVDTVVEVTVLEVQGASRFDTAVRASQLAYPSGTGTVLLATGRNWPDALGGAALAGAVDGPILLSEATGLPDSVKAEIARLGATHAIILGGPSALGAGVERDLRAAGVTFERLGGSNRFQTAELIAQATISRLGTFDGTALIATGLNFPDALAASPMAAAKGWPIFLTSRTEAPAALVARLKAYGVTSAVVLGGQIAVSDAQYSALAAGLGSATRLSGADRYSTCAIIAQYAVDHAGMSYDGLGVGVGTNFPDALAGGPLCAKAGGVMLLSTPTSLPGPVQSLLLANKAEIGTVHFLGGPSALTPAVRAQVTSILN